MNFVLKLVTIAAVGLGCSNVAAAQDFFMPGSSPMDYNQIQSGVLTQQIDSLSIQRLSRVQAGRGASRSYGRGTPSSGVGRSGLAAFETSYRVSAAESRQALDAYVKRIARKNPEAARLTDAQFRRHDASKIWRGIVQPFGLRDGDVADQLTSYMVLGYMITTGDSDPSAAAVGAARPADAGQAGGKSARRCARNPRGAR